MPISATSSRTDRAARVLGAYGVVAGIVLAGAIGGCVGGSADSSRSINGSGSGDADAPAPASPDPVTLWRNGDLVAAVDRLEAALRADQPVLPPPLRLSEQQYVSRLEGEGVSAEAAEAQQSEFMRRHQALREFARAIAGLSDEALAGGDEARAARLDRLIVRFGRRLQEAEYTLLTQAYGRGIVEFGSERLDRHGEQP